MANLLLSPENYSAVWTSLDTTVTADQGVAPDGTTTADDCQHVDASAIVHQGPTVITADQDHSWSNFFHEGNTPGAGYLNFFFRDHGPAADRVDVWIDLQTMVISSTNVGGSATLTDYGVELYADGWYRPWIKGGLASGQTDFRPAFALVGADGSGTEITTASVYAWGGQLELGDLTNYTSVGGTEVVVPAGLAFARDLARDLSRDLARDLAG